MQGKSCVVRVEVHPVVSVPTEFFFFIYYFPAIFVFRCFLLSRRVRVVNIQPAVKKKEKKNKCFSDTVYCVTAVFLPSQCSLFFPCNLFVCACYFPVCACVCARVFLNSPCILLAAGAFIIRTCTVYCELSTRLSA